MFQDTFKIPSKLANWDVCFCSYIVLYVFCNKVKVISEVKKHNSLENKTENIEYILHSTNIIICSDY